MSKNQNENRGFASMDEEKQREIASKGGKASHGGQGQEFTSEEGSSATLEERGRAGGEAVSEDREHMAEIGRKGGEAVSQDREHMAEIGKEGAEARNENR